MTDPNVGEMRETGSWEIEVFFDGACPLCRREIDLLRRLDRRGRVRFTDIVAPGFDTRSLGVGHAALMDRIHARSADGEWFTGVEVFRRLYAAVGGRWIRALARLSRARPVDALLVRGYEVFARNRLKWTGRCEEGTCRAVTDAV